MSVTELRQNLNALLRYVGSAVVGVLLVWVYDGDHDVFWTALESAGDVAVDEWVVVALVVVTGVFTYYVHRTLTHRTLNKCAKRVAVCVGLARDPWPDERQLQRARWLRRGEKEGSPGRSVQNGLDEMNAATHFLYCSAISPLLIVLFLLPVAQMSDCRSWLMAFPVAVLLVLAFMSDMCAAVADRDAFEGDRDNGSKSCTALGNNR